MWGKAYNSVSMVGLYSLKEFCHTETEYDTEDEWKEEVELIEEMYASTKEPTLTPSRTFNFEFGDRLWGYYVLDFEKEEIVKIGGSGIYEFEERCPLKFFPKKFDKNSYSYLTKLDKLFRGNDEIPKHYNFDNGEYEGWLQFRWGNGKNAIK